MLQTQGMPTQQANLYPNPGQQQFQPSPNVQSAQMPLPPNTQIQPQGQSQQTQNNMATQQLEQFFRAHPEMEKGDRAQAINQLMMRAKQGGAGVNMGSLAQNQPQQQRPHPVGLNGFTPQPQPQQLAQQAQRMPNQPIQQNVQQPQQQSQPQMPRTDSYNSNQPIMPYPGVGDTQRQIEAVSNSCSVNC